MTWPDIVATVDRHPRLAAGRFQVEAARAGVDAAGAIANPTLEATGGEGFARVGDDSRGEWGLALSIPLGWIAQRSSKLSAAAADVEAAVAESESLRRDVLLQLRTLFWNLVYEQARVDSLETLEEQTAQLVSSVTKRVEKGESRPVEATRAAIELEKVAGELEGARTSLLGRQAQLSLWLGGCAGTTPVAAGDLTSLPATLDRDTALAGARTTNPALTAAQARTRALVSEVDTERLARVPSFAITGFTTSELDRQSYGVGVAVDVPLGNWNSGRIAQAEARLAQGRKQAEATALEVESSVIEAQAACRAAVVAARRMTDKTVPLSEFAASTMEKTYRLGEASLLEVIDARRTLLESRRLYLGALVQAHIDCSRLDALVGEEPR
ncbi:MAG: TolC family protein [Deltaproteobacteria bacterium]|nr:TolC family protein [Deltaproteobacteria bacterium]